MMSYYPWFIYQHCMESIDSHLRLSRCSTVFDSDWHSTREFISNFSSIVADCCCWFPNRKRWVLKVLHLTENMGKHFQQITSTIVNPFNATTRQRLSELVAGLDQLPHLILRRSIEIENASMANARPKELKKKKRKVGFAPRGWIPSDCIRFHLNRWQFRAMPNGLQRIPF